MSQDDPLPRSPELMSRDQTALLVVDVQEKLIPLVPGNERIVWNIRRLIEAAAVLGVPTAATEQYPKGLGNTVATLADGLGEISTKTAFSCGACPQIFHNLQDRGICKLLVVGIEAHVCVMQTVMDVMAAGWRVYVATDAVGSRSELDCQTALRRMDSAGATLVTTETAMFEWCETSAIPEFKEISRLVRETEPPHP